VENVFQLSEVQVLAFALVLIRISAFLVAFPLVEGGSIPPQIKILFSLAMTVLLYPVVNVKGLNQDMLSGELFALSIKEAFMGLFVGFLARFFFHILSVCGEIITITIGLSSDQLFNPHLDRRVTSIEQFHLLIGGLFFLAFNGHHIFIQGLMESFNVIPLAKVSFNFVVFRDIVSITQDIFIMGIKLSAPVLGAIFLANMAMGIIGRAVPQINVLVTSWPVNIMLGFSIMIVSLPLFMVSLGETLNWSADNLFSILRRI
jgi:flagellar biosynthetic protein FliR